jgi:hypothetical protein
MADAQPSAVTSSPSSQRSAEASFCAEVSSRLRCLPQAAMSMSGFHSDEEGFFGLPDYCDHSVVDRLLNVEKQVSRMSGLLEQVLSLLQNQGSSGVCSQQSLLSTQSSFVSSSGSLDGSCSPVQFSFACPLCGSIQHSPKSHCEHLRKVLQTKGECSFVAGNPFHDSILSVFRSPSIFVCWYRNNNWQHDQHPNSFVGTTIICGLELGHPTSLMKIGTGT